MSSDPWSWGQPIATTVQSGGSWVGRSTAQDHGWAEDQGLWSWCFLTLPADNSGDYAPQNVEITDGKRKETHNSENKKNNHLAVERGYNYIYIMLYIYIHVSLCIHIIQDHPPLSLSCAAHRSRSSPSPDGRGRAETRSRWICADGDGS